MATVETPASVSNLLRSIGEQLSRARQELRLSPETVSRELKIHCNFIHALEEGNLESLPGVNFYFAFLRTYSRFLRLDSAALLAECKNNPFLNEAFQGKGVIVKSMDEDLLREKTFRNVNKKGPKVIPFEDLKIQLTQPEPSPIIPPQASLTQVKILSSTFDSHETEPVSFPETDPSVFEGLDCIKGLPPELAAQDISAFARPFTQISVKLVFVIAAVLLALFVSVFALKFALFNQTKAKPGAVAARVCQPFKLHFFKPAEIKVFELNTNLLLTKQEFNALTPDTIFSTDDEGVRLSVSDTKSVDLYYGNKRVEWGSLPRDDGDYIFSCQAR